MIEISQKIPALTGFLLIGEGDWMISFNPIFSYGNKSFLLLPYFRLLRPFKKWGFTVFYSPAYGESKENKTFILGLKLGSALR